MLNDANCLHKVYLACGYIKTVWGRGNYCAKMQQGDGSPSHYNSNNMVNAKPCVPIHELVFLR